MEGSNVDHVEVFMDEQKSWRWHAVAGNGEIVSEGESHSRVEDAARAARGVLGETVEVRLMKAVN